MVMGGSWGCPVALLTLMLVVSACDGHVFYVGGRSGWVVNPDEDYNHWAARNRFQIDDKIVFKYNKGEDSAVEVTKKAYYSCNTTSPLRYMGSGQSFFKFDRSGLFYFISGAEGHCAKGQKMVVLVMARRQPISPSPSPKSPPSPSPSPKLAPGPSPHSSPVPSPTPHPSPKSAPTPHPSPKSAPVPSPSPKGHNVPSPSPKVAPVHAPVPSPSLDTVKAPAPAPETSGAKLTSGTSSAFSLAVVVGALVAFV